MMRGQIGDRDDWRGQNVSGSDPKAPPRIAPPRSRPGTGDGVGDQSQWQPGLTQPPQRRDRRLKRLPRHGQHSFDVDQHRASADHTVTITAASAKGPRHLATVDRADGFEGSNAVGISGNTVVAGVPGLYLGSPGAVYLFTKPRAGGTTRPRPPNSPPPRAPRGLPRSRRGGSPATPWSPGSAPPSTATKARVPVTCSPSPRPAGTAKPRPPS